MNNKNVSKSSNSGIGSLIILCIVSITLKLTGHINLSWLLITVPLWGGVAVFLVVLVLVSSIFAVKEVVCFFSKSILQTDKAK